jgi:uncharacterized membrane protein
MENYPEIVAKIANDYLARVKSKLSLVPPSEQDEFLKEIQSHLFEAYQQTPGEDDVARILTVLRNLGEPAEVVADRLPGAMVRSGSKRNLPLYIVAGIFIALFGIPLGFGGVSVLVGFLLALTWFVVVFFAITGTALLAGSVIMLIGLSRFLMPQLLDRLIALAAVENNWPVEFINQFSPADQGVFIVLFASIILAAGLGMLWVGKRLLRGLRFLFTLAFDWARRAAKSIRKRLDQDKRDRIWRGGRFSAARTGSQATR